MSIPKTMQAVGIHQTGDFDVIEKLEFPFPENPAGNLLVKVEYGGVNFIDTYFRCVARRGGSVRALINQLDSSGRDCTPPRSCRPRSA